jgi:serine/threonine protein phosphatase PrpC
MRMQNPVLLTQTASAAAANVALQISVGHASDPCGNLKNEDFFGSVTPQDERLNSKGILLAIADGLSGGAGRAASESIVYSVLDDYYATPEGVKPAAALSTVIVAINRWLYDQNQRVSDGMLSTLSALVLQGDRYCLAHVGDTRVYRFRDRELHCITNDHVWRGTRRRSLLRRAVGLDTYIALDFFEDDLTRDDIFLMVSDGVWDVLSDSDMREILERHANPREAAAALVEKAVLVQSLYTGNNDATAAVIHIDACGQ